MGARWKITLGFVWIAALVSASVDEGPADISPLQKNHILYLTRQGKLDKALASYESYKKQLGKHDSEILEQLALILLNNGMSNKDQHLQLISLFGASLAGSRSLLDLCEIGLKSTHPNVQLAAVQLAGQLHENEASELLLKCFSSDYLAIRMEAAAYLAQKKHRLAVGYIESLMNKLPPFFHCYFSEMYASIGSTEAIYQLKKLLHSSEILSRVAAILAIAHLKRDDLLKDIRVAATHLNPAEQEASAFALGALNDSNSLPILEKFALSGEKEVSIAAIKSLILLSKEDFKEKLMKLAAEQNLFAIQALSDQEGTEDLLYKLSSHRKKDVKINAVLSLLRKKDPRALESIHEILLTSTYDLGVLPHFSAGRSLMHYRLLPSLSAFSNQKQGEELIAFSLAFREQLLLHILDMHEEHFLKMARVIFDHDQKDLFPACMSMLANRNTTKARELLQQKSEELGKPFLRHYANLTLYKLKAVGPYEKKVEDWIKGQKNTEIIQFRPVTSKVHFESQIQFQLTPKETSALLIDTLSHIASLHEERGLDLFLEMMKKGEAKNLPILAGLLIKALE